MDYLQLRFRIRREQADELGGILENLGALSLTWENAGDGAYFEVAWPGEPDWSWVCLTGLFAADCRPDEVARQAGSRLGEALVPEVSPLAEQDWERVCLAQFQPQRYCGDLWVCPSWITPPDPDATTVVIDPGLAFGTGDHATTALCLDWISEHDCTGTRVMDYGCGSGILAIACLLRGAAHATGVDVDPRAVSASTLNAERNGVAARYAARLPREAMDAPGFDLVIANILSNVLIDHREQLADSTRHGGTLLLTGILEDHAGRVRDAFESAFTFETQSRDGWSLLIGNKRSL